MKSLAKAMVIVLLATPACAQGLGMNLLSDKISPKTQEDVDAEKARDKAYQSGLKKLPDQAAKSDPWGNMRGTSQNQTQARPNAR